MNDDGTVKNSVLFPKSAEEIGKRLKAIADNEILDEERDLVGEYKDIDFITLSEDRLKGLFNCEIGLNEALTSPQPEQFDFDYGLLHSATLYRSKEQLLGEIKTDKHIIHAINSIDELTQTANLLSERLHEWYGLHWPEFSKQVGDREYVKLILEYGTREKITESSERTKDISGEALGGELSTADIEAIKSLAKILSDINSEKDRLEDYVRTRVEEIAPNTSKVAGPLITAKLMALTNGIERLARVSASTIQLLGAEKALFRHLKDGSSPPKHGIIFQHPMLHSAPYWQRGKIARALATKISIAVRLDFYHGSFQGDRLEEELQVRIKDIRSRYPNPPRDKGKKHLKKGSSSDLKKKSGKFRGKKQKGIGRK